MAPHPTLILHPGKEKSLLRRHPWIFSGAIERLTGAEPASGDTVEVRSSKGQFLARAAWSPTSQIRARVWTFDSAEAVTPAFFRDRLGHALALRAALVTKGMAEPTAGRLVHGESDGLPGLIVDRYGEFLICQFLSAGPERWRGEIVAALRELAPCRGIYERSDVDVREKEGLERRTGLLAGAEPPETIEIAEGRSRFLVDVRTGHKTGFYLDQRDSRQRVAAWACGAEVLNCFAYTGAFAVRALEGGAAAVTNVETSASALEHARRHFELNGYAESGTGVSPVAPDGPSGQDHVSETPQDSGLRTQDSGLRTQDSLLKPLASSLKPQAWTNVPGDVFQILRRFRDQARQFDIVVLDPPKFAESRAQLEAAARGYKDINVLAFKLLRPGGILFTFSCSGLMEPDLFQKIVADAALDAHRVAQILERLGQAPDHPTLLAFPEGAYLKGLVCRVE
jgi:23S rRNA (cytosine1962-C5)-methyltransferase